MLFLRQPQTAEDIRAFCARFGEGIRVEYKRTIDNNVRESLPKIVSSFANSLGGVLIIGVVAGRGVPQEPIEGFEPPPGEELPLTVENICLQNIHPPVLPRSTVVPSDIAGRVFLVIEVEESWEAPHAIENSRKVYVRTGNAANPYDLSDVDLIIELVKRRQEPSRLRENLLSRARRRASGTVPDAARFVEISISPPYPRHALCSAEEAWEVLRQTGYRGGHFFPLETLRRVENGAGGRSDGEYGELSKYGMIFARKQIRETERDQPPGFIQLDFRDLFHTILKMLQLAAIFYDRVGYRGNISVEASVTNIRDRFMPFTQIHEAYPWELRDFQCLDEVVFANQVVSAENLRARLEVLLLELLSQICWSFWQALEEFPTEILRQYVHQTLQQMGFL